jgi:hypothetical protein
LPGFLLYKNGALWGRRFCTKGMAGCFLRLSFVACGVGHPRRMNIRLRCPRPCRLVRHKNRLGLRVRTGV